LFRIARYDYESKPFRKEEKYLPKKAKTSPVCELVRCYFVQISGMYGYKSTALSGRQECVVYLNHIQSKRATPI
jgi:hypothetical protein